MTANCDKSLIALKYTDFPTENGLIYTDFFLNILRTQNTALGTVMRGGAVYVVPTLSHPFSLFAPLGLSATLSIGLGSVTYNLKLWKIIRW